MNMIKICFRLRLVVVMHTNKELMAVKQPLKVFPSTTDNNSKLRDFIM